MNLIVTNLSTLNTYFPYNRLSYKRFIEKGRHLYLKSGQPGNPDLVNPHGVEPELVEHGVGLVPGGEGGEEVALALRLDLDGIGDHQRSLRGACTYDVCRWRGAQCNNSVGDSVILARLIFLANARVFGIDMTSLYMLMIR